MRPVRMGKFCRSILTKEARDYIESVGYAIHLIARANSIRPVNEYRFFDIWLILPRRNCDCHNYGKVIFDSLESGKVVTNDKFVLPRYMGVYHDKKTQAVVKVPI